MSNVYSEKFVNYAASVSEDFRILVEAERLKEKWRGLNGAAEDLFFNTEYKMFREKYGKKLNELDHYHDLNNLHGMYVHSRGLIKDGKATV